MIRPVVESVGDMYDVAAKIEAMLSETRRTRLEESGIWPPRLQRSTSTTIVVVL